MAVEGRGEATRKRQILCMHYSKFNFDKTSDLEHVVYCHLFFTLTYKCHIPFIARIVVFEDDD